MKKINNEFVEEKVSEFKNVHNEILDTIDRVVSNPSGRTLDELADIFQLAEKRYTQVVFYINKFGDETHQRVYFPLVQVMYVGILYYLTIMIDKYRLSIIKLNTKLLLHFKVIQFGFGISLNNRVKKLRSEIYSAVMKEGN